MAVGLNLVGGAATGAGWIAEMAARTGVHGGDKHKIGWIGGTTLGAGDRDGFALKGPTKCLEDGAGEFREFVKEEDAMMSEGDFAWSGGGATPDNRNCARGVMGRTKGAFYELGTWFGV